VIRSRDYRQMGAIPSSGWMWRRYQLAVPSAVENWTHGGPAHAVGSVWDGE
jgi:L-arabinose isomerase